jgi:hypothetical protein
MGKRTVNKNLDFGNMFILFNIRIFKKFTYMNFSSILLKISRLILAQRSEKKGGEEGFRRKWHNSR